MNTVWNYLRRAKAAQAGASGAEESGDETTNYVNINKGSSNPTTTPLDLLLSEAGPATSAKSIAGIRNGKTYLSSTAASETTSEQLPPKCVASLYGHEDRVWGLAWHPSGDLLVSCGGDKTARLWLRRGLKKQASGNSQVAANKKEEEEEGKAYPYTWECVHTIANEHAGTIRTASWSADGSRLALCSFDGTISIWLIVLKNKKNNSGAVDTNVQAHHEDDETHDDETRSEGEGNNNKSTADIHVELEVTLDGHESEVKGIAWFCDTYNYNYNNDRQCANLLAALAEEGADGKKRSETNNDDAHEDDTHNISKSNSALSLVAAEASSRIVGNHTDTDKNTKNNKKVCFARRPLQLATCSRDRSVWVWEGKPKDDSDKDESEKKCIFGSELGRPVPRGVDYECAGVLTGHPQDIKSVVWMPSAVLVGKNANGPLLSGDDAGAVPLSALPPAGLAASGVLLSASYDDTVRCWEEHRVRKDDWDCVQTLAGHDGTVWEVAVQPNAEVIETIFCSSSSAVKEEEQPAGKNENEKNALIEWRHALPTNNIIVTCSDDGRIIAWQRRPQHNNNNSGAPTRETFVQLGSVGGFADGRTIFSVSFAPPTTLDIGEGEENKNNDTNDNKASSSTSTSSGLSSSYSLALSDVIAAGTGDDSFALFRLSANDNNINKEEPTTTASGAAEDDNTSSPAGVAADETLANVVSKVSFEKIALVSHAHNGEVNCVRFCPAPIPHNGIGANNKKRIVELATASDDGEVKIWAVAI